MSVVLEKTEMTRRLLSHHKYYFIHGGLFLQISKFAAKKFSFIFALQTKLEPLICVWFAKIPITGRKNKEKRFLDNGKWLVRIRAVQGFSHFKGCPMIFFEEITRTSRDFSLAIDAGWS